MALSIDITANDLTGKVFSGIIDNIRNSATIAEEQADAAGVALQNSFRKVVQDAYLSGDSLSDALKSKFDEIVANSGEMGEGIARMIGNNFEGAFDLKSAKSNLQSVEKQLQELKEEVNAFPALIGKTEQKLEELKRSREEIVEWWSNTTLDMDDPINIAKYNNALKDVDAQIEQLENKLYSLKEGQEATNGVYADASASYYILSSAIEQCDHSNENIRKRIGQVEKEMYELAEAGQTDSDKFKQLRAEIIELQKVFMQTNRSISNAAKQGAALSGVLQGLNTMSGVYSAGVGVISLFNDDVEKNAEIQKDLQALIAVTTGLQSVYNATVKTGALMQGIMSVQLKAKAAADALAAKSTGKATIAQKAFNLVAKANPYVLLAMAIITVVGALAAFAHGQSVSKKATEKAGLAIKGEIKDLEYHEQKSKDNLKIAEAQGKSEKELIEMRRQSAVNLKKEALAIYKSLEGKKELTKVEEEQKKVVSELIDKYHEEAKAARKDEQIRHILSVKKAKEEILKLEQDISRENIAIAKRETDNKKRQIDLQTKMEVDAIRKRQKEYHTQYGAEADPNADAAFDKQVNQVYVNARLDKKAIDKEFDDLLKDLQEQAKKSNVEIQLATLNDAFDNTDGLEQRLSLLQQIYEMEKQIELKELERKRNEDLEMAKNSSQNDEEYQQREQMINAAYDTQVVNTETKYDNAYNKEAAKEQKDALDKKLEAYTQYAEQVVEIEENLQQRLKDIEKSNMSDDEKEQARSAATNEAEYMTDQAAYETLGMTAKEIPSELASIVEEVFAMSLEQIQAEIPKVQQELQSLKKTGKDTSTAQTRLNSLLQRSKTLQGQIGNKSQDSGEKMQKNYSAATKTLQNVVTVCADIKDAFSEYLGDTAADALDTMQNVAGGAIAMISGLQTLSTAAATEISTVEKASVILTIISAAIQVTMAIVNAFVKNFSKNAQIQAQIDKNKEAIEDLKRAEQEYEHQQKSKVGRDYWNAQWKQIKNANDQAALYADNIRLANEQLNNASTKKKKENAQDNLDDMTDGYYDAMDKMQDKLDEFYEAMIGTDLDSFAEGLADSIIEGFEDGLSDMGQVWDNAFDDLMKQMLTQQISMDLKERLQKVFERIRAAFSEEDTSLDRSEIEAIKEEYKIAKEEAQDRINAYKDLYDELGLGISDNEKASSGGFESMSQDTAEELNARFTALQMEGANIQMLAERMQVNVEDIQRMTLLLVTYNERIMGDVNLGIQIAQDQLMQLEIISQNTSVLEETNRRLKAIEINTDRI